MPNLDALSTYQNTALTLSNLILVTPQKKVGYQPQNPEASKDKEPPPKFLFDFEGEQAIDLESDITDHYAENNTSIQDQIALKPELYTVRGFVGELNDVAPEYLDEVKAVADKLVALSAYTPELSATALIAYNTAFQTVQATQRLTDFSVAKWGSVNVAEITGTEGEEQLVSLQKGLKNQNKQQLAFQMFYGYWRARTLFTVQTPWAIFKNVAIFRLKALQAEDSDSMTDFQIVFKLMRFADTMSGLASGQSILYDYTQFQGRAGAQGSPLVDIGSQTPTSDPISLSTRISGVA